MKFELRSKSNAVDPVEAIQNLDRRAGLMIGLGVVGLVLLVVGLVFLLSPVGPFRGDDQVGDDLEDEVDPATGAIETLTD
jgi:tetrahydromethanopterin S-methyltransferase subunit B